MLKVIIVIEQNWEMCLDFNSLTVSYQVNDEKWGEDLGIPAAHFVIIKGPVSTTVAS